MTEFKKGDKVYFGRKNGEKTLGEVTKVNRKTYKVKTLESRGTKRSYEVGSVWTVPKTLCWAADEKPARVTTAPRRRRRYRRRTAEEMFEMRAAFGRGVDMVDVLTGERFTT
jgi:hypothetical protein